MIMVVKNLKNFEKKIKSREAFLNLNINTKTAQGAGCAVRGGILLFYYFTISNMRLQFLVQVVLTALFNSLGTLQFTSLSAWQ